jgi:erythromycin esterase-like protein
MKLPVNKKWVLAFAIMLAACKTSFHSEQKSTTQSIPFHPLRNDADLDVLINQIGNARVVLLGESTHGTHEFYQWRAEITRRLIEEKGFNFIAVEGDWVDSYRVNDLIKGPARDSAATIEILKQYDRWPSSMWGNYEMAELVQWLNQHNQTRHGVEKIGFYGLDLYSFWEWTKQPMNILDSNVQRSIDKVRKAFSPYNDDALKYASAVRNTGVNFSTATEELWNNVQHYLIHQPENESEFLLQQQALLSLNGERYFRTMVTDKVSSWNIRDGHMAETIRRLLKIYGNKSKAIIWVHNGHAGDAHYSQMAVAGYTSVAGILRQQLGRDKIFSIGFGTDRGEITAGKKWNAPLEKLKIQPAMKGSWENILHDLNGTDKIVLSNEISNDPKLNQWLAFRSIGASYSDNAVYGSAIVPQRFDAFVFIDSTTASHPIPH